jgi:hypothetical protein
MTKRGSKPRGIDFEKMEAAFKARRQQGRPRHSRGARRAIPAGKDTRRTVHAPCFEGVEIRSTQGVASVARIE